jgi:radical SAM enzyme (TIGR01210 family)
VSATIDQEIRSRRPPKVEVDPYTAQGSIIEDERRPNGKIERAMTVFLTGAECPFTCSFCDLWRFTIDGPTEQGAIPQQLMKVVSSLREPVPDRIKLYNASNFFDERAIPSEDLPSIAALTDMFRSVTVESHASTIGKKTLEFKKLISGRLEVAMGLETINPVALSKINKRLDLERFDRAAEFLATEDIDLRVFVLLGTPFTPANKTIEWTVRSVEHAVTRGASVVSIIPVRSGNGEMERLQQIGEFTLPKLAELEQTFDECLALGVSVINVDLWDIDRLSDCDRCTTHRVERLQRMNFTGRREPRIDCHFCAGQHAVM